MRRARPLLLMKAHVHWMDSFAKQHPTPPMMTLPQMLLSKILKAQLQGWWLIVSFSSVFTRRSIATTNGSSVSLSQFFRTWPSFRIQWRRTISTSMKYLIAPGLFCLISMVKKILSRWASSRILTGLSHLRRNSRRSKFLTWWPALILHCARLMKMKTWTTLWQALLQQPTPTTLALLHRLHDDILQGR